MNQQFIGYGVTNYPFHPYYKSIINNICYFFKLFDVEQTTHVFLEQQGHKKSQRKIKGECQ